MPRFTDPGASLSELTPALASIGAVLRGDGLTRVFDVRQDSRSIEPGDLFVARAGEHTDGSRFIDAAIERGAVAVLGERDRVGSISVPSIEVDDVARGLALAAEFVHGSPTSALHVIAITGTNGKTTTAFLVEQALRAVGARPARMGTLGSFFEDEAIDSALTTPEADAISRFAGRVLSRGATHLVLEASSIALVRARLDGVRVKVAAFSNLSQDHLDYHTTMEQYREAKARLFETLRPELSVLNVDDAFGRELMRRLGGAALGVGRSASAGLRAVDVRTGARGVEASVQRQDGPVKLESRLLGEHNVDNLLLALGIIEVLGLDTARAAAALSAPVAVPGRLERCDTDGDTVTVVVDYAHTPDALGRVLQALAAVAERDVICVFGCGGDRDPGKRAKMGAAVAERASSAIVTSDNPRSEAPEDIVASIVLGFHGSSTPFSVELDRARAIRRAVLDAEPGDTVLIAGKGHEPYQILGDLVIAFDDREHARRALAERRGR